MGYIASVDSIYTLTRGRKKYEASNHLGNVILERPLNSFFRNCNLCRINRCNFYYTSSLINKCK